MKWDRLSSIAEILSSVAIVVTLVYLAVEINQNSVVLQANSRDNVLGGDLQHLYRLVDNPQLWASLSLKSYHSSKFPHAFCTVV